MNKKQTNGLIVAAVIFVIAGVISVLTNALASKMQAKESAVRKDSLNSFMEGLHGSMDSALANMPTTEDFIAVMNIEGTIQADSSTGSLYGNSNGYNHDMLMNYVSRLTENSHNKGIILRMDTPGGTVYHADELYQKLREYKEKTQRPIWVYMESMCCSGGVYIASVADEQYANRLCETGSIGVILSNYDMSGLYEKLGIKEVNIVSAKNKDMGSMGKPMTDEQKAIFQAMVDEYYDRFVSIVAEGRNMPEDAVRKLADGRIYTATQAQENGLIDGIMGSEEFDRYVRQQSGVDKFYQPSVTINYFAQIFGSLASVKEKSESEVLVDLMNQLGSGVPMYYAKPFGQ